MKSSLPKGGEGEPDDDADDDHHADGERRRIRFNNNVGAAGAADEGHNAVPSVVPTSQQPTRPALVAVPDHIRNAGKRIRFDEAVIAEHDLERGTRMTIDEPDTPFVRTPLSSGESSEDSSSTHGGRGAHIRMGEVSSEARLQNLANGNHVADEDEGDADGGAASLRIDFSTATADEAEELEKARKAREFHEKRRRHYNEMQMVRALREQGRLEASEEEEDDQTEPSDGAARDQTMENCRHLGNPC
ncbi:hypothetical protein FOZ61_010116 [Perkinsus olseni]|uniref:Uncharacterized protein n=1 Tax=Perkinsus olseni TaxID=32597 RepID=A0A7J6KZI7_PEROL|nr:hypothetical protein FOZ61_010116 [Perkinsus olseni]